MQTERATDLFKINLPTISTAKPPSTVPLEGWQNSTLYRGARLINQNYHYFTHKPGIWITISISFGTLRDTENRGTVNRDTVNRGTVNRGMVNRDTVNMGTVNRGMVNRGMVNRSTVNRDTVNMGTVNRGKVNSGW